MLTLTSRKSLIIGTIVLILIILILVLPIKIDYKIKVQGKLLPAKEWIIYKGTDGRLTSLLTDYKTGINQSYNVTLFDRGDAMKFAFSPQLHSGASIELKDTIAMVYSNEIERQIENLKGQIISAKASLSLNLTGEKESIINQEKNNLAYAIKQSEEQKKILDRISALYEKELASKEEYEIAKGTDDLNEINISISRSRLQSVETGSKQEQVGLIKSQITALEKELAILKKRFDSFLLLSPITGIVNRKTNSDTLLVILDTTEFVLITPIKIQDKKFITSTQQVEIYFEKKKQNVNCSIIELDNKAQLLNGFQVITATSYIDGKTENLIPGLLVECYINTGGLTPLQYVERIWQRLVN